MTRRPRATPDRGIRRTSGLAEPPAGAASPATAHGQQDSPTHRVVLVVEVDEPTDLSAADLVAMADVLREAAAELAPQGTTRASVELGIAPATPSPQAISDNERTTARTA